MTIDWITVSAQLVNFLILVWLLKRLLYQPVLDAMARREERIAASLRDAQEKAQAATAREQHFLEQSEQLAQDRADLLTLAQEQAEQEKRLMLDEARTEVAASRTAWQQQVYDERNAFLDKLRHESAASVLHITQAALRDLANQNLEAQIIDAFISRLADAGESLHAETMAHGNVVQITTSFPLDPLARQRLADAVDEFVTTGADLHFSESADLICGIELNFAGRRLSWNVADYCKDLDGHVMAALDLPVTETT
jgi:F-type H+-transporting ATPase subunit b